MTVKKEGDQQFSWTVDCEIEIFVFIIDTQTTTVPFRSLVGAIRDADGLQIISSVEALNINIPQDYSHIDFLTHEVYEALEK